jgi:hypothetical protein
MSLRILALKHKNKIKTRNENRLSGGFHLTMTNTGSIGNKCLNTTQGEKVPTQPLSYRNYIKRVTKCSCTDNSNPSRMNIVRNKLETSSSDYLKKKKSKVLLCDGVCVVNGVVNGDYTTRSTCLAVSGAYWSHETINPLSCSDIVGDSTNSNCTRVPLTKTIHHSNGASYVIEKRKSDLRDCGDVDGVDMPNNSCSA